MTFNIGASASSTVLWKTGNPNLGYYVTAGPGDGQCTGVGPVISRNNASFTVLRNTNATYNYNGTNYPGASTCWRNQMNPTDSGGGNLLFTMGQQYTFTFQTVVNFNGNYLYQGHAGGGIDVDIPAIVWQTHSYGENPGQGPCDLLVIQNTYVAYANGITQYGVVPQGGQPTWNFHTCDESDFTGHAYNSPDTLYEGEVDNWQIDFTAMLQGQSGGSVVVQRNGAVVYNNASGTCDSTASNGSWWNFGPYMFYWPNTGEPPGWNNAGVTVKVSDMTWTTPNGGGGGLSRRRGFLGHRRNRRAPDLPAWSLI